MKTETYHVFEDYRELEDTCRSIIRDTSYYQDYSFMEQNHYYSHMPNGVGYVVIDVNQINMRDFLAQEEMGILEYARSRGIQPHGCLCALGVLDAKVATKALVRIKW